MKKIKAIYSGTFDPITYGHIDLVERASRLFDHIVVAIAENKSKSPLFSLKERVELAKQVFERFDNISVQGFDGLLVDFVREQQARVVLRGIRVVSDFDYEFQMASMNRMMAPEVETIFLSPADEYTYISSSLVRTVAKHGGNVSLFVPKVVEAALSSKFSD